jgi:hypothetical protein
MFIRVMLITSRNVDEGIMSAEVWRYPAVMLPDIAFLLNLLPAQLLISSQEFQCSLSYEPVTGFKVVVRYLTPRM